MRSFLLLAAYSLLVVQGLQPVLLDVQADEVRVTATAECGVAADGSSLPTEYVVCNGPECLRTCGRDGGEEIAHGPELVVDGNRNTSWQSPPVSFYQAQGEGIGSHNITIDLGRAVHVVEVQLWSGEGAFPASLELYGSLDGTGFTLLASLHPGTAATVVTATLLNVSGDQLQLTIQQRAASHVRYLQLRLVAPPTTLVTSDPRSGFYSIGEVAVRAVEVGGCPPLLTPSQQCYGEPETRRTLVLLSDVALHRLLWQRTNQSDWWNMDDVIVLLEECPVGVGGCEGRRVREDFNGTVNPLLWDSNSFPASSFIGPRPCPHPRDPTLLLPPGGQIISRPLLGVTIGVIFDVEFPLQPPFCSMGAEYSPVEARLCRSIEGVLGECLLVGLVSSSECGNCLDQLTFQLRYLQESIDSALFPANLTILDELHTDIHAAVSDVEMLEGLVLVLRVGFGLLPSLPPSALPLPPSVPRLDLQLVPPTLSKLEELKDLLEQLLSIVVVSRDDLESMYSILRARLEALLVQADQLRSDQRVLSSTALTLLRSISDNADAISVARETANQIVILISSRQYSSTAVRVQMIVSEVVQVLEMANRFLGLAQINSQHAENVASSLMAVGEVLVKASNLATETVGVTNGVREIVRRAQEVEQEVMALLREALEVLEDVGIALGEGEVAVVTGEQLLAEASELYQNSSKTLPDIISLIDQLNRSILLDGPRLVGLLRDPPCRSGGENCTAGEEHLAGLVADHAFIINSSISVYTLRYANDTLTALVSAGTPLDLSLINSTALSAQERAREAVVQLTGIDATLGPVISIVLTSAQQLGRRASDSLAASARHSVSVTTSIDRTEQLATVLGGQQLELTRLSTRLGGVASFTDEASLLFARANASLEVVRGASVRVEEVREGAQDVGRLIPQIRSNVQSAESTLQDTEQRFPLVSRLLHASRRQAEASLFNVSGFIDENERIVRDIDALIARLSSVHSSVGLINSPVRLSSEPAATEAVPYLSLQPPPGRQLGDVVQFEDLDLYLWPSAQYQTPSLLFYAGPVRFPDQQNRTLPETREDVIWVMAEENQLRLGWELGGYRANSTYPARVEGESHLRLTRVGSQFRLQFSPGAGEDLLATSLLNSSLLFHSSDRTAFLLGGWPQGAELGSESTPLPLSSLRGFEGQFQLALFNGDLWGLWNVRSTSETDLIGDQEFRRNELAGDVAWHANPGFLRTASTISFDGTGYLFTEQFGTEVEFAARAIFQTIVLFLRPNDGSRGLVMYAYQTQESVSLEVFYRDGQLNVLISRHGDTSSEVLVNHSEVASQDEEMQVRIRYIPGFRRYIINEQQYNIANGSSFFTNLRQVKAWFGGVREDHVEGSYIPREKTGYFGCLDMYVQKNFDSLFEIFRDSSFTDHYLNSRLQSGLSATCYANVYVREVSFATDAEGVAYTYLPLPPRASPCAFDLSSLTLSLSVLPLEEDGYVLAARDQGNSVSLVLRSGILEATISSGAESVSLSSRGPLELGVWHYLLLSLDLPNNQNPEFSLFVDGLLQEAVPSTLSDFSLVLPTSAPVGVANPMPVLFVGGVDPATTVPTFSGCMKDLTFDLCPLSFQAPSLVERYPPGVGFHSCPASTVVPTPELPVQPTPPQQRVCLGVGPVELDSTHGGFTRNTQLRSGNVAGLLGSEWNLTLSLRQRAPGHVISVRSDSGVSVRIEVMEGGRLSLTATCGGVAERTATSPPLPHDTFTAVAVSCVVVSPNFLCNLTVDNVMDAVTLPLCGAGVNTTLFDPLLPITLGLIQNSQGDTVAGFEGCIADLAINGDVSGFRGVKTGIPCYNQTVPGLGLTGISRISQLLPVPSSQAGGEVVISVRVRPLLESGVVVFLTEPQEAMPVLAVGLVQGVLRLSNFSGGYITLAEELCDGSNEVTFDLTVSYTESRMSVAVAGSDAVTLSPAPSLPQIGQLRLTIGNVPELLPSGGNLLFLLSEDMLPSALPAGLAGCLVSATVLGVPLSLASVDQAEDVLAGFCPDG